MVKAFRRTEDTTAPGPDNISGRGSAVQSSWGACFSSCFKDPWTAAQFPSYGRTPKWSPSPKRAQLKPWMTSGLWLSPLSPWRHIITVTDPLMDPLQFVYHAGRGADDAKTLIMDTVHKHLEHPNATDLFADLSSAFNTLQPHILADELSTCFHLDDQLILWTTDFLINIWVAPFSFPWTFRWTPDWGWIQPPRLKMRDWRQRRQYRGDLQEYDSKQDMAGGDRRDISRTTAAAEDGLQSWNVLWIEDLFQTHQRWMWKNKPQLFQDILFHLCEVS